MSEKILLRVEEAASLLSIGRTRAYELVRLGVIPSIRLGRCVRIPREALVRWIEAELRPIAAPSVCGGGGDASIGVPAGRRPARE
jgi:excisionase family DNA binding protein